MTEHFGGMPSEDPGLSNLISFPLWGLILTLLCLMANASFDIIERALYRKDSQELDQLV